jgi:acid phosphatase
LTLERSGSTACPTAISLPGEKMKLGVCRLSAVLGLLLLLSSCGGGSGNAGSAGGANFNHVVVVVLENQNFSDIIGNTSMPFLNSLANTNSIARQYFANTHPSIGNYFMMTTGQTITNDDNFSDTVSADNIVRELTSAGKTWKIYAESLPTPGFTGGDVFPYQKNHNPFAYFTDVVGTPQANNIVPFSQLSTDLGANALPNFSFIVPNIQNDMHDCPAGFSSCTLADKAANTDNWLKNNLAGLLANTDFQSNGFLVITFDESADDNTNGGGQVATVLVGPRVKQAFSSNTLFQHQSLLRTSLESLGVTTLPGAAASAPSMSEFLQ